MELVAWGRDVKSIGRRGEEAGTCEEASTTCEEASTTCEEGHARWCGAVRYVRLDVHCKGPGSSCRGFRPNPNPSLTSTSNPDPRFTPDPNPNPNPNPKNVVSLDLRWNRILQKQDTYLRFALNAAQDYLPNPQSIETLAAR